MFLITKCCIMQIYNKVLSTCNYNEYKVMNQQKYLMDKEGRSNNHNSLKFTTKLNQTEQT